MGRVSIKNKLVDFQLSDNWKSSNSEDYERSERRWRRRDFKVLGSSKHSCRVGATRTTSKSCGNKGVSTGKNENPCMAEDEVDEDYRVYLDTYFSNTDVVSGNGVLGPYYRTSLENGDLDPDYGMHLENYTEKDNRCVGAPRIASKSCGNEGVSTGVNGNSCMAEDEVDEDYRVYLDTYFSNTDDVSGNGDSNPDNKTPLENGDSDPDYRILLENYTEKDNSDGVPFMETERGPRNKRPHQDVSIVSEHNCHSGVEFGEVDDDYWLYLNRLEGMGSKSRGKSLNGTGNSQVSDQAFDTPEVQSEIDEDYNLLLNSGMFLDVNWVHMPDRKTTKTNNEKGDSSSSDSDLIILEPNQICGNTPFISSKAYDSSFFENEEKPRESKQLVAYDPCQFRRRLMEYLERPYDQKEYDSFLLEVHQKREKERHAETRRGPIKSYHSHGVNNSYLELFPDFDKAIDEFKEQPHKVLFLLRGFFFWLQNLIYGGIFKPWHDEICLEILREM